MFSITSRNCMNAVALLISPSGEPAPRLPLAGGLLVVLEGTAVNPRPLVCRCCSGEQHLLASFNVPPGELISGCRRQAFACPSQGTPGSRWSTSTCVSVSQLISVRCFQLHDSNESFKLMVRLLDFLVDSKKGQTKRFPKNLCLTKSTCYPPWLSTIVKNIVTLPDNHFPEQDADFHLEMLVGIQG